MYFIKIEKKYRKIKKPYRISRYFLSTVVRGITKYSFLQFDELK